MEARLKEAIRKYVRERNIQKTLDEMSVTGNVAGYDTPAAFSKPGQTAKKNKRLANVSGGTVVDNLEEGEKDWALGDVLLVEKKHYQLLTYHPKFFECFSL